MPDKPITSAYVYDIIGHKLSGGETASKGIEQYTKELVQIKLDLEELERNITELSVPRYGFATNQDIRNSLQVVCYLLKNLSDGVTEPADMEEFEKEHQSLLNRIASAREAMISGRVSAVDSIGSSNYNSRVAKREMSNWVQDGTFPKKLDRLESAADRVDRRLNAKRQTANARISLTVSVITVFISLILLTLSVLSFFVSLISTANILL